MICPKCGNQFENSGNNMCPKCGSSLNNTSVPKTQRFSSAPVIAGCTLAIVTIISVTISIVALSGKNDINLDNLKTAQTTHNIPQAEQIITPAPSPTQIASSAPVHTPTTVPATSPVAESTSVVSQSTSVPVLTSQETIEHPPFDVNNCTITVSSTLASQQNNSYSKKNLTDKNKNTAWVENADGVGINETIRFQADQPCTVNKIKILNGYNKNKDIYNKNCRVRTLKISHSSGSNIIDLGDTINDYDVIEFPSTLVTDFIEFRILEVYRGTKYEDTAISEIEIN